MSVANPHRAIVERDEVAGLQLTTTAMFYVAVDRYVARRNCILGVSAGIDQARKLEKLP